MNPPRTLPPSEFHARIKRLQACQKRRRLDALLIVTEINRYYFTGLETSNGILFSERAGNPVFFTDFRYLTMAKRQAPWLSCRNLWRPSEESGTIGKMGTGWRRIGYEGQMEASRFLRLQAALPDAEWIDIGDSIAELRAIKSPAEVRVIRDAIAANDTLFETLMQTVTPGMSEWEIRAIVRREADRLGEGEAFETIACAGRTSAECHHHSDATLLRNGQPLLVDLGLRRDHYCADMTRCAFFGTPSPLYCTLFAIVLEANLKAVRGIRPGERCCDIDALARRHIEKAGFGRFFGHSLGHGLGLEVHESPSFSPSCKTVLKPNMILTVEPGIYLPGKMGIRIEDVIRVTRTGCEVLTRTPHAV